MAEHTIGLLLGTEEDWSASFEALVSELGAVDGPILKTERIHNEPFDLRYKPRYALVIDRLAWWYDLPRAWLKKVSLMDDVYLMNNPFTFQAMEKHSAYCAMMRLGLKVPETWLIPHKQPPDNPRFFATASRYALPFHLGEIAEHNRRSTWAWNLLAAGGIEGLTSDGYKDAAEAAAAFKASGARITCICSSDAVYAVQANVSIIQVFLAGFLPGLLVMALYSGYLIVW